MKVSAAIIDSGIVGPNKFSIVLIDKDGNKHEGRNFISINTNRDGDVSYDTDYQNEFNSLYPLSKLSYVTRDVLEYYLKYPFYKELKKIFDEDKDVNSLVFFVKSYNLSSERTLHVCKSKRVFPNINKIEINLENKKLGIGRKLIDSSMLNSIKISESDSIATQKTTSLENDLIFTNQFSTFLEKINTGIKYSKTGNMIDALISYAKDISDFSQNNFDDMLAYQDYEDEIKSILFTEKSAPLFESNARENAQKTIAGIDKTSLTGQNFFKTINFVKKIQKIATFQNAKDFIKEYKTTSSIDTSYFEDYPSIRIMLQYFDKIDSTNYVAVDAKKITEKMRDLSKVGISNKDVTIGASAATIASTSCLSMEEVFETLYYLPNEITYMLTISKDVYEQELATKKSYKLLSSYDLLEIDNDTVAIVGNKRESATQLSFFEKGSVLKKDATQLRLNLLASSILFDNDNRYDNSFVDLINKRHQEVIKHVEVLKKNTNKILEEKNSLLSNFSDLTGIGIKERKFSNFAICNSTFASQVSIKEISQNKDIINAMHFSPAIDKIVRNIAKKAGLEIPRQTNIIVKPSEGTKNIPSYLKEERISEGENLGMMKFGYIPTLDIKNSEEKDFLLSLLEKEYGKLEDFETLKDLIAKSSFLTLFTKKTFSRSLMLSTPSLNLIDEKGTLIHELNIDIYKYVAFLEKYKILDYKDIIKKPEPTIQIKLKVIKGVGKLLEQSYSNILGKEKLLQAQKLAFSYLLKKSPDDGTNGPLKALTARLQQLFYEPLSNNKVLFLDTKKMQKDVNILPIPPHQKQLLLSKLLSKSTIYEKETIDKLLIDFKTLNPSNYSEIETFLENIRKNIDTNVNKAEKEALSFFHLCKLMFSIMKTKQSSDREEQLKYYDKAFASIKEWGRDALGLFKEQIETAMNAVVLNERHEDISFYIFHSMGTGKTRLALFYLLLYTATNPKDESVFSIQTKNQDDIYDQLSDMLPTMSSFVNVLSSKGVEGEKQNTIIPLSLIDNAYPNFFTQETKSIFVSNSTENAKQIMASTYVKEFKELYSWAERNVDFLDYIKKNCNPKLASFQDKFNSIYRKTLKSEVSMLGSKIKEKDLDKYLKRAQETLFASIVYLDKHAKNGFVNLSASNVDNIHKKLTKFFETYFTSAIVYEKEQSQNRISLMAQSMFPYFPGETTSPFELKVGQGKRKNTLYSSNDIDNIEYTNVGAMHFSKAGKVLSKTLKEQYSPLNNDFEKIWLFYKKQTSTQQGDVLEAIKDDLSFALTDYLKDSLEISDEYDINTLRAFKNFFIGKLTANDIYDSLCPSILNDEVPIPCEVLNTATLLQDKDGFETFKNAELGKNTSITAQKISEKAFKLLDANAISKVLNSYFYNLVLTDFMHPANNFKDKTSRLSLFNIASSDLKIQFLNKTNNLHTENPEYLVGYSKYKEESHDITDFSLYLGTNASSINKVDPQQRVKTTIVADAIAIGFNGTVFNTEIIHSNLPQKVDYSIMFNSSYIFLQKKEKVDDLFMILDEAHKNKNKDRKIAKNNANFTGTPTNGASSSVAKSLYPDDEDLCKSIAIQMSANSGIQRIKSPFYSSFLEHSELRSDFILICEKIKKDNLLHIDSMSLFEKMITKYDKRIESLSKFISSSREDTSMASKRLAANREITIFNNFRNNIFFESDFVDSVITSLKKGLSGSNAIFASIPKELIVEYPGFANPASLAKTMNSEHGSRKKDISIKEGEGRTYTLVDAEDVLNGDIPMLPSSKINERIKNNYLHIPYLLFKTFKGLHQTEDYRALCNLFKLFMDNIFYSPNKKVRDISYNQILNVLINKLGDEEEAKSLIKNHDAVKKAISPESANNLDAVESIFNEKIAEHFSERWENAGDVKQATIIAISELINLYLSNEKDFSEMLAKAYGKNINELAEVLDTIKGGLRYSSRNNISIDTENTRGLTTDKTSKTNEAIPLVGSIELNLRLHFNNIFKPGIDAIPARLGIINSKENEVLGEFLTDCSDMTINNAQEDKNSLILTTRTSILQLKIAEILQKALSVKHEKPFYLLINAPSDFGVAKMISMIDEKKLSDNNVFIIKSEINRLYNDYNYKIPKNANFAIIANYSSIAEGFRFPRVNENIISGQPTHIETILQAISRVFFPGKVFNSNVTFAGAKASIKIGSRNEELRDAITALKELAHQTPVGNFSTDASSYQTLIKETGINSVPLTVTNADVNLCDKLSGIVESVVSSLKFMSSEYKGVKEEAITNFLVAPEESGTKAMIKNVKSEAVKKGIVSK